MDVANTLITGKYISVKIEELLPDLILVSFKHGDKIYQGILLDSTKRSLPCGVYYDTTKKLNEDDPSQDKLYSVGQRHTYLTDNENNVKNPQNVPFKKNNPFSKTKSARMTVRLRPRQVLCSNCQSICNEKSENVGSNKMQKSQSGAIRGSGGGNATYGNNINGNMTNVVNKRKDSRSCRETRQNTCTNSNNLSTKVSSNSQSASPSLVPKLIKLKASDIETATSVGISSLHNDSPCKTIQSQASINLVSENEDYMENDGKLPKLKLISSLPSRRSRGKLLKMTISSNSSNNNNNNNTGSSIGHNVQGELVKECGIRTRSRGSIDEQDESSLNRATSPGSYKKNGDANEKKETEVLKSKKNSEGTENLNKHNLDLIKSEIVSNTNPNSVNGNEESSKQQSASLPKLTILPINNSKPPENSDLKSKSEKMNLRKKRSLGSMEDLWDESILGDNKKLKCDTLRESGSSLSSEECDGGTDSERPKTTPILKISFGPGKGTVLKIPAKSTVSENDSTESDEQGDVKKNKSTITKAARKALKRAKKEAQKRSMIGIINKSRFGGKSPMRLGGISPARLSGFSPGRFSGTSPGRFGGTSPGRFGGASPGRFGGASPARFGGSSPSIFGSMMSPRSNVDNLLRTQTRKHKHKVKHKKKHKEDRKHKSDENVEPDSSVCEPLSNKDETEPLTETTNMDLPIEKPLDNIWKVPASPDQPLTNSSTNGSSPKQNILQHTRHKLSISIKRVNNASYITCDPNNELDNKVEMDSASLQGLSPKSPLTNFEGNRATSGISPEHITLNTKPSYEENDFNYLNVTPEAEHGSDHNPSSDEVSDIPDFPWIATSTSDEDEEMALLYMKLGWHDVDSCDIPEGHLKVGDVVWGKANDLPWWPAKITRLKVSNDTCLTHQAQVCWYGCSASSLLPTESLQPFLKKFNIRYKKQKRGPYQDAVREANYEADQILNEAERPLNICESPITASPREVNVVS